MKIAGSFVTCERTGGGRHLVDGSSDEGSFELARGECKANVAEGDSIMFLMDVKIKKKHASLKRTRISKTITSGGYRVILPVFNG